MKPKGKRTGIFHNFTMDIDPKYEHIEKFRGGVPMFVMESKDFISNIVSKVETKSGELVSINGRTISFPLSFKEV